MKTVRVKIRASQTIHYDQIVTMTQQEWRRLKGMKPLIAAEHIDGWIDHDNVEDAGNIEDDFEAIVVSGNGHPVHPRDEYIPEDITDDA